MNDANLLLLEKTLLGEASPPIPFGFYMPTFWGDTLDPIDGAIFPLGSSSPAPFCGTIGCIAGLAAAIAGYPETSGCSPSFVAREWLGVDKPTASNLFTPNGINYNEVTPLQAAAVVRHLRETGVVDWTLPSAII